MNGLSLVPSGAIFVSLVSTKAKEKRDCRPSSSSARGSAPRGRQRAGRTVCGRRRAAADR